MENEMVSQPSEIAKVLAEMKELREELSELKESRKRRSKAYEPKRPRLEPISMTEIYEKGLKLDLTSRLLFFILYLTGCRISEAMELRARDVYETEVDGKQVVVFKSVTRKNKRETQRELPCPKETKNSDSLMLDYVLSIKARMKEDEYFFNFCKRTAQNYMGKITANLDAFVWEEGKRERVAFNNFPIFCHYLRHCRATDLVRVYGFKEMELTYFMGWSDPRMARTYVHLDQKDIARKMMG